MQWTHSPLHAFVPGAWYIVTAATHHRHSFFNPAERRDLLQATLFEQADRFGWSLQAWAIMANHHHFVAEAPQDPSSLSAFIGSTHSLTARHISERDKTPGRKVWFQYWDTCITNERSWLARLVYVHSNPVKHGLVTRAEEYPWCSMKWFLSSADDAFQRTALAFPCERVSVPDDF